MKNNRASLFLLSALLVSPAAHGMTDAQRAARNAGLTFRRYYSRLANTPVRQQALKPVIAQPTQHATRAYNSYAARPWSHEAFDFQSGSTRAYKTPEQIAGAKADINSLLLPAFGHDEALEELVDSWTNKFIKLHKLMDRDNNKAPITLVTPDRSMRLESSMIDTFENQVIFDLPSEMQQVEGAYLFRHMMTGQNRPALASDYGYQQTIARRLRNDIEVMNAHISHLENRQKPVQVAPQSTQPARTSYLDLLRKWWYGQNK